jgi:2-polyprenyl-3-methyl-5-hydroxy-6-metoxy-1,4-benzoquinol methylase
MTFLRKMRFTWLYYGNPPWDANISPPELMEFIQANPSGKALDLGCGTGTNCITLAQHGWQVTGVDFIPRAIRAARKKVRQTEYEIDFRIGDVTKLDDLSSSYDLILDIGCLHNLPSPDKKTYLTNLLRLLAPEGIFLLYVLIRQENNPNQRGMTKVELLPFKNSLELTSRTQNSDRGRPSSWLTFHKKDSASSGISQK